MTKPTETEAPRGALVSDPELVAMQKIAKAYEFADKNCTEAEQARVRQWAGSKYHPAGEPFDGQ